MNHVTPHAAAPERSPINIPSTKNGSFMKPRVAPTYFIMSISSRRANTLVRMELDTITTLTIIRTLSITARITENVLRMFASAFANLNGALTLSTPSMLEIASAT